MPSNRLAFLRLCWPNLHIPRNQSKQRHHIRRQNRLNVTFDIDPAARTRPWSSASAPRVVARNRDRPSMNASTRFLACLQNPFTAASAKLPLAFASSRPSRRPTATGVGSSPKSYSSASSTTKSRSFRARIKSLKRKRKIASVVTASPALVGQAPALPARQPGWNPGPAPLRATPPLKSPVNGWLRTTTSVFGAPGS